MTPAQKLTMDRLSPPAGKSGRLLEALRRKFKSPRDAMRALGLDAGLLDPPMAFDQGAPRFSKSRAVAWLRSQGLSEADCDEFLEHMGGGGGADQEVSGSNAHNNIERGGHGPTEAQHNAMEAAAHSDPMEKDELPTSYGRNHMPRHALDSAPAWKAARAIAPGLANIRIGVIGY